MPREQERNEAYKGKLGIGTVRCKYRYTETRFGLTDKGAMTNKRTLPNRCAIMPTSKKQCTHPLCNEKTCNIVI